MAIIRMAASAGAAVFVLTTVVAAAVQAQAQTAPLQLVPGVDQAKKSTPAAATRTAKATKTVAKTSNKTFNKSTMAPASRKNARQAAPVTPQASSKTARSNSSSKQTADAVASRRQGETTKAQSLSKVQRRRVAEGQQATGMVALESRPILRGAAPAPRVFAQGSDDQTPADNVMRGSDSISLVARLPWWRNDRLQEVQYGSVAAENAVMAAAGAWLAANGEPADDSAPGQTLPLASPEDTIDVADAGEINEIDLAAQEVPAPPGPTFLQSLVAFLGSVAAAAAASARFLFV